MINYIIQLKSLTDFKHSGKIGNDKFLNYHIDALTTARQLENREGFYQSIVDFLSQKKDSDGEGGDTQLIEQTSTAIVIMFFESRPLVEVFEFVDQQIILGASPSAILSSIRDFEFI